MTSIAPSISDFNLLQLIGKSTFSPTSVYLVKHTKSQKYKALRATDLENSSETTIRFIQHELLVSRIFQHNNILVHENTFIDKKMLYIVTEMMNFGSCRDLLEAQFKFGLEELVIAYILSQVLEALGYLHNLGFIHRNVKASHILVSGSGKIKLSGHRNVITTLNDQYKPKKVFDYPKHDLMLLPWLSPEILKQNLEGYCCQSDIYSLGITACELANGHAPFTDMPPTKMLYEKLNGTVPRLLDETTVPEISDPAPSEVAEQQTITQSRRFSDAFHKFVFACLHFDPASRPTALQASNDIFFQQKSFENFDLNQKLQPLVAITSTLQDENALIDAKLKQGNELDISCELANWNFGDET